MIQKYYNDLMDKAESMIEKNCKTCLDHIVCWSNNTLQTTPCENWKPEFTIMQEKIIEIEKSNNT